MGWQRNVWRGVKVVIGIPTATLAGYVIWDVLEKTKFDCPNRGPKKRHENSVLICGAGISGVATAYFLARDGFAVTVLDTREKPGQGSSDAAGCFFLDENGLMLRRSYISDCLKKTVNNVLGKGDGTTSPFLVTDSAFYDRFWYRWLVRALRTLAITSRQDASKRCIRDEDGFFLKTTMDIAQREDIPFPEKTDVSFINAKSILDEEGKEVTNTSLTENGVGPFEHVERDHPTWRDVATGKSYVWDCGMFTRQLAKICQEKYDVIFVQNAQIEAIELDGTWDRVSGVRLKNRRRYFGYDQIVICMGAASVPLLHDVGVHCPVYSARGYALTLNNIPQEKLPKSPMICWPNGVMSWIFDKYDGKMRFVSAAEFTKPTLFAKDEPPTQTCVDKLREDVKSIMIDTQKDDDINKYLAEEIDKAKVHVGCGPWSPDDMPIVSSTRYHNLFINCGHGHGWRYFFSSKTISFQHVFYDYLNFSI